MVIVMLADFHFCNRIRSYREALGLTQSELASKVGVSKNAISSFERKEYFPSAMTALYLCVALGCSFEDLFYLE